MEIQTLEVQHDAALARIAELEAAIKDTTVVAANARANAAESVAAKLTDQLGAVSAERDSLVSEVAKLKAEAKSSWAMAADIAASSGIDALRIGHGGPVRNTKGNGTRSEAVEALEAASKQGPEAFAAAYKIHGAALVGG